MLRSKPTLLFIILAALVASQLAACGIVSTDVNIVRLAGLTGTSQIDVFQFDSEAGSAPYVLKLSVTDDATIGRIIAALDTELRTTLKVECIPEYELIFHLPDTSQETFGYTCDPDGPSFIRGDQAFLDGEDYAVPEEFDEIFLELIAAVGTS
jgi:hypothetical protein